MMEASALPASRAAVASGQDEQVESYQPIRQRQFRPYEQMSDAQRKMQTESSFKNTLVVLNNKKYSTGSFRNLDKDKDV